MLQEISNQIMLKYFSKYVFHLMRHLLKPDKKNKQNTSFFVTHPIYVDGALVNLFPIISNVPHF
jgi:hypothetical protein